MPSYSGGGSGKGGVYSSNSYGGNNNAGHAVMTASLKGDAAQSLGRVSAYSAMAADTDDVEKAAAGAIAGFEEGAVKESEAFLNGENEKAALATQIDEDNLKDKLDAAAATPDLDKLNTKLKEKKQQQDKQDKTCDQDPFGSWGCALSEILSFGASIFGSMIGAFF